MKIAFFSHETGKYSSFATLIMSIMICEKFALSTVMMQNKSTRDSAEEFLQSAAKRRILSQEENAYFALDGIDFLIWLYQNHRISWNAVEEVGVPLCGKGMYIPLGTREQSKLYPQKTADAQWDIVKWLEKMTDVVMVDCGFKSDVFSDHLRKNGEVKVICIKHDKETLDQVLVKDKKWYSDEIILLVGYDFRSVYNKENISRIYRIPIDRIAAIPQNSELDNYMSQGKLLKFFIKNRNPFIGQHNSYCLRELREASEKIMEAAYGKMR